MLVQGLTLNEIWSSAIHLLQPQAWLSCPKFSSAWRTFQELLRYPRLFQEMCPRLCILQCLRRVTIQQRQLELSQYLQELEMLLSFTRWVQEFPTKAREVISSNQNLLFLAPRHLPLFIACQVSRCTHLLERMVIFHLRPYLCSPCFQQSLP